MKENQSNFIKKLAACSIMIAVATVLSMLTVFHAPLGGSITAGAMVPIIFISLLFDVKWGLITSIIYSVVQLLLSFSEVSGWGLSLGVLIGCLILDYVLAYSVLGFAGIFGRDKLFNIVSGTIFVCFLRFFMHFLSGLLFFGQWAGEGYNAFTWAIVYNGGYMIFESIITIVLVIALSRILPTIKKMFA